MMTAKTSYSKGFKLLAGALVLNLLVAATCFSQSSLTTGTWTTEDSTIKVQFYQRETQIYGRILSIKGDQNVKDTNNKEKENRKGRKVVGLDMFQAFVPDGEDRWKDGSIYDPETGRTYTATMQLKTPARLEASGFVNFSLKLRKLVLVKSE